MYMCVREIERDTERKYKKERRERRGCMWERARQRETERERERK